MQLHLDDKHRQLCLRLLSKICKAQEIIPSSYILQEEFLHVRDVQDRGGFSEVRNGEYLGRAVAIKELKPNKASFNKNFKVCLIHLAQRHHSNFNQRFCREIIGWKHISHPNILPLLGVCVSRGEHQFRILSEWMPNETLKEYTRSNPEANRLRLVSPLPLALQSPPPINHL